VPEFDLDTMRQLMTDDPDDDSSTIIAAVPLDDDGDQRAVGLVRELVTERIAYARACEDVWEYRYQWGIAIPATAVLASGIVIVAHHRTFFGAIAALSAVTILAAVLGLL